MGMSIILLHNHTIGMTSQKNDPHTLMVWSTYFRFCCVATVIFNKNWWESHFELIFSLSSCARFLFFAWKGAFVHACPSPARQLYTPFQKVWLRACCTIIIARHNTLLLIDRKSRWGVTMFYPHNNKLPRVAEREECMFVYNEAFLYTDGGKSQTSCHCTWRVEEEEDPPCISGVSQCPGKCVSACIVACLWWSLRDPQFNDEFHAWTLKGFTHYRWWLCNLHRSSFSNYKTWTHNSGSCHHTHLIAVCQGKSAKQQATAETIEVRKRYVVVWLLDWQWCLSSSRHHLRGRGVEHRWMWGMDNSFCLGFCGSNFLRRFKFCDIWSSKAIINIMQSQTLCKPWYMHGQLAGTCKNSSLDE